MGLDMSLLVKSVAMDSFARPIDVTPTASSPGADAYRTRGIWHQDDNDFMAEDGSIVTDHKVSVDILESEFPVLPRQGDKITIPADDTVPAEGTFTVLSVHSDGGGMMNVVLSEFITTIPANPLPEGLSLRGSFVPLPRQRGKF
jgi:hypothetical protein